MRFRIHGTGCALLDYLYTDCDFGSPAFTALRSRSPGDGGLSPGRLVFSEELEHFAGRPFADLLAELSGGRDPDAINLGGPSAVALVHAAQMLDPARFEVAFHGASGDDEAGARLRAVLARTPLESSGLLAGPTPSTYVFSDPRYGGQGERSFVNLLGAAAEVVPETLAHGFFAAEILEFGGTALLPKMHARLGDMLAHASGAVTVVNTVFDFVAERRNPHGRWPLGSGDEAYALTDLLVADCEEAMRLAGTDDLAGALRFLRASGLGAFVVTHGALPCHAWSSGRLFAPLEVTALPVSAEVGRAMAAGETAGGDTTGCGDNFAGGLTASLAEQLASGVPRGACDLIEACVWAVAAGGLACFYPGGTLIETAPGEKRSRVERLAALYRRQLSDWPGASRRGDIDAFFG